MSYVYRIEQRSIAGALSSDYSAGNREYRPEDVRVFMLTDGDQPFAVPREAGRPQNLLPDVEPYTPGNLTAEPVAIGHEGLRLDGEESEGQAQISLPEDHPAVQLYMQDPGALAMTVTVMAMAKNDNPATMVTWPRYPKTLFLGVVASFRFDESRCILQLETVESLFSRQSLGATHPRECRYALFDSRSCRLQSHNFRTDGLVSSVSSDGLTVTVSGAGSRPSGYFAGGRLHLGAVYRSNSPHGGSSQPFGVWGGMLRDIVSHTGNTLKLAAPLPPGTYTSGNRQKATIFPGCRGSADECRNKFNNFKNYGGYPFIPIKDPTKQSLVESSGVVNRDERLDAIADHLFGRPPSSGGGEPGNIVQDLFG